MSVFIALSVIDTIALIDEYDILVKHFITRKLFNVIWSLSMYDAGCKISKWLVSVGQTCSSQLVLLFTLERFISVRFPLKRAIICTKRRINIAIVSIVIVACLTMTYKLYYFENYPTGMAY